MVIARDARACSRGRSEVARARARGRWGEAESPSVVSGLRRGEDAGARMTGDEVSGDARGVRLTEVCV